MRHFYLIVDTETTKKQTVADFGAVVVTKQGRIVEQFGAMVHGHLETCRCSLILLLILPPSGLSNRHRDAQKTMMICLKAVSVQSPRLNLSTNG